MEIKYKTVFSKRTKIEISVERDKSIIVRAPLNTPADKIAEIIEKKKLWLFEKINHSQKYDDTNGIKKEFVSGTTIMYLGKNYRLDIVKEKFEDIKFSNKFMVSGQNEKKAAGILKEWFLKKADEILLPAVKYFAERIGVQYNKLQISDLQFTWGSCSPKNNLNFNWKLIKAPMAVIQYVIVHELAHLIELNHTKNFWNIVRIQLPDFDKSKDWLKEHGNLLEIDL